MLILDGVCSYQRTPREVVQLRPNGIRCLAHGPCQVSQGESYDVRYFMTRQKLRYARHPAEDPDGLLWI